MTSHGITVMSSHVIRHRSEVVTRHTASHGRLMVAGGRPPCNPQHVSTTHVNNTCQQRVSTTRVNNTWQQRVSTTRGNNTCQQHVKRVRVTHTTHVVTSERRAMSCLSQVASHG